MRIAFPAATMVVSVLWLAGVVAFAPAWRGHAPRRTAAAAPTPVERTCDAPSRVTGVVPAPPIESMEVTEASATDGGEDLPPPSPSVSARPGPSDVAAAVTELEGCVGGPDFAPTMESVRRSLVPLLASDPRAVEDALARVLDLRAAGEVRAVLVEALVAGPGAKRAADMAPALLMDPSPLVREAARKGLAAPALRH